MPPSGAITEAKMERRPRRIEPWTAVCVQANFELNNPDYRGRYQGDSLKKRNLDMMCAYIDACFSGPLSLPVKLVCFPEFSIGGMYSTRTTTAEVKKYQAITIPGPETDRLAAKAKEYGIYVAAVNHENDPLRPDFFFNTAFIINPGGKVILKYRKLNTLFGCNPHDIFDEYTNPVTGKRDFFPVVETAIGRLSCGICADLWMPEIPKVYALKGADIWLHLTAGHFYENGEALLRARAIDNTIYVLHENFAAGVVTTGPLARGRVATHLAAGYGGNSMVLDYYGNILARALGTGEELVMAEIDVMKLRSVRQQYRTALRGNAIAQTRTELFAPYYSRPIFPPNGTIKDGPMLRMDDEKVSRRRRQAVRNALAARDCYSEDDVA
jgi:predicted amidohydrolase